MRVVHLVPGTGNFHCGGCLRDHTLVKALRTECGHEVIQVPLYLPLVLEDEAPAEAPVFLGGVNLYLQQKAAVFRHTPRWVDRLLDSDGVLRAAAERSGMTRARDLAAIMLSSFEGVEGVQRKEWRRLLDWIRNEGRPDVVSLSNGLLCGIAKSIAAEVGVPVVASLQGEDSFIDGLPEPARQRCWAAFRAEARHVALFVAVSCYYAERMRERLHLGAERVRTVYNGVDVASFAPAERKPDPPVVGFFARMCHAKGLHTLVRAFVLLKARKSLPGLTLRIGGAMTRADEEYVAGLRGEIEAAGCTGSVSWHPNLDGGAKRDFLRALSVLSVPATYGEAFGLYLIEAMASGVPVVQPDCGAFPEIIERTGGGMLVESGSEEALAAGLEGVLSDEALRTRMARSGRRAVEAEFGAGTMARAFSRVLEEAAGLAPKDVESGKRFQ